MTPVLYLYAVLPRVPRNARLRGLRREPVRFVRSGRLVAAVGEVDRPPSPVLRNLQAHDRVVRRLAEATRAALPARFGSLAPSDEALRQALRPRSRALQRALARVRGRVQMTLRVRVPEAEPSAGGGPGTRHLRRLAARDPRAHEGVRLLLERLRPLVREEQVEPAAAGSSAGRIHHLVDRAAAARYRAEVKRFARERPEVLSGSSGPWVPYSFAETDA